jgi:hypothetical protein
LLSPSKVQVISSETVTQDYDQAITNQSRFSRDAATFALSRVHG